MRHASLPERFWLTHLFWPVVLFIIVAVAIEMTHLDLLVADWFYALEGHHWALRRQFITSDLLHKAAQNLSRVVGLLLLLMIIASRYVKRLRPYGRVLLLLFLSLATSNLLVSIGKNLTHVDCPWDLLRYGGERLYIRTFELHSASPPYGRCFPSGHASAGYGFIALYFVFLVCRPRWKWTGLAIGLGLGFLYGLTQQLRGAHFISHDLWALAICWISTLFWYRVLLK